MRKYLIYYWIGDKNIKHQSHTTIADKIEIPKKYSFIVALAYQLQHSWKLLQYYPVISKYSFICCHICSFVHTLLCLIVGRVSNKMYQGGNYQALLKWRGCFLGHSLIIIKWTWGVFFPKFAIWPPLQSGTKEYSNFLFINSSSNLPSCTPNS